MVTREGYTSIAAPWRQEVVMDPAGRSISHREVLGHTLHTCRIMRNVSLRDMARVAGMTGSGWWRVETGQAGLTAEHLLFLWRASGIRPAEFFKIADRICLQLAKEGVAIPEWLPPPPEEIEDENHIKGIVALAVWHGLKPAQATRQPIR